MNDKHTKGELSFEPAGRVFGSSFLRVDKPRKEGENNECIAETDGLNHEANAARLCAGWNLLNRLDEMGIEPGQVPQIVEALKMVEKRGCGKSLTVAQMLKVSDALTKKA